MAYLIGSLAGGILGAFFLSRLLSLIIFRWVSGMKKVFCSDLGALVLATLIAGYGFADGGPPKFIQAFVQYLTPVFLLLVVDIVREVRSSRKSRSIDALLPKDSDKVVAT